MKKKSSAKKSNSKQILKKLQSLTNEEKEEVNKERYNFLKDIQSISDLISSYHDKEWELRKLSDKIAEYQLNLSEANISLIKERQKIMNYINEIEDFRSK